MGWHRDSKYSLAGKFNQNSNGQTYNTVAVIFTVGEDRYLQWRMRLTKMNENGRKYYKVNPDFNAQSVLESGSICIINPRDEMPHNDIQHDCKVHYQHGNVKITKDEKSIGFVFRVSPHVCMCNVETNKVVFEDATIQSIKLKESKGRVKITQRQIQYDILDLKTYHDKIIAKFNNLTSMNT